jgi:hypothetical protein
MKFPSDGAPGTVMPRRCAELRLSSNSKTGCSIGRSAGLAPLRIRADAAKAVIGPAIDTGGVKAIVTIYGQSTQVATAATTKIPIVFCPVADAVASKLAGPLIFGGPAGYFKPYPFCDSSCGDVSVGFRLPARCYVVSARGIWRSNAQTTYPNGAAVWTRGAGDAVPFQEVRSQRAARGGINNRLTSVDETNPPRMTMAMGPSISCPA